MSGFELFDPSAFVQAEEARIARDLQVPEQVLTGNPILDLPPIPNCPKPSDISPDVAECSPSVAPQPEPPKGAENRAPRAEESPAVATVATVAMCRAGVISLAALPKPRGVGKLRYKRLIRDAESFERMWLEKAVALGWSVEEMYGCWRNPLASRLDCDGLVHCLDGRKISLLTAESAVILVDRGNVQTYRRGFDRSAAVPIWLAYAALPPVLTAEAPVSQP
jgi:hypothetical protein